jgi:hypothetical protein
MDYLIERYQDISVYWTKELDGGGRSFGQHFVPIVRNLAGKVPRLFEFCAGAGFIGFSLLAHGLCDSLCLSDVNPDAVAAANRTIEENNLGDRVTVYLSEGLRDVPTSERWDLVVGNPPHFCADDEDAYQKDIIRFDPGWRIHEEFYAEVRKFLKPHGSVILLENYTGSNERVFEPLLRRGNLEVLKSFMYRDGGDGLDSHYFLWSRQVADSIVSSGGAVETFRVTISELDRGIVEKRFGRAEGVQIEVLNDTPRDAEVGLQTRPHGPDRILRVPPDASRTSGPVVVPKGSLYVFKRRPRSQPDYPCRRCRS